MATIEVTKEKVLQSVPYISAFIECSPEVQQIVAEMIAISEDAESSDDERTLAGDAIFEALFPCLAADVLETYEGLIHSEAGQKAACEFHEEEATFANRVRSEMASRGLTQEQLAIAAGVGQPAISNILNRHCRPQRATVRRLAKALGMEPNVLWPS